MFDEIQILRLRPKRRDWPEQARWPGVNRVGSALGGGSKYGGKRPCGRGVFGVPFALVLVVGIFFLTGCSDSPKNEARAHEDTASGVPQLSEFLQSPEMLQNPPSSEQQALAKQLFALELSAADKPHEQDHFAEALQLAEEAARETPDDPLGWYFLGSLLLQKTESPALVRAALVVLEKASTLAPENGNIQLAWSRALFLNGRNQEAVQSCEVLLANQDKAIKDLAAIQLAEFFLLQNRIPEGVAHLRSLLDNDPENLSLRYAALVLARAHWLLSEDERDRLQFLQQLTWWETHPVPDTYLAKARRLGQINPESP